MGTSVRTDDGYTSERYLQLVDDGVLAPDDRVELLDGVIVAVAPQDPAHAATTGQVAHLLSRAIGDRASVRVQSPLIAGTRSVPEPDVAVVPGAHVDYGRMHPTRALLVVEIADSSLPQDRLTKARVYAGASVAEYWIVNLRTRTVEVMTDPDVTARLYRRHVIASAGATIALAALDGVTLAVDDLLRAVQ